MVGRRIGQIFRKKSAGGIDRALDVLGCPIDVSRQVELQGDRGAAERARRRHLRQRGDQAELALQRGGDGCGNIFRACARKARFDLDGGKVDLRQGGNRQQSISHDSRQDEANDDQRDGDGALDEGPGYIHRRFPRLRIAMAVAPIDLRCPAAHPIAAAQLPSSRAEDCIAHR